MTRYFRGADLKTYAFSVAQIFNLPYRRFVIGKTLLASGNWQVKNLRYSRLQVCATGAACTLNTYLKTFKPVQYPHLDRRCKLNPPIPTTNQIFQTTGPSTRSP